MSLRHLKLLACIGLALVTGAASAQEAPAPGLGEARANFARPVVLAADDVPAFAAPPAGFADDNPKIPHGSVEEFRYESKVTGTTRKAAVYLPPGYSPQQRYPVLYLLHGIAGNHDEWRGYVRATNVLDQLLADAKAVPMVVVMPNGRARADDQPPPGDRIFTPEHIAAFSAFEADLLDNLVPAVDLRYATQADPSHRAIAGLSMGGGQALNFGLSHLDRFAWVGGFSSAPNTRKADELLTTAATAGPRLRLLYLSCGKQDGLINVSQSFHRALRDRGVPHVWNVDEHAHDRESWAENLYHFAPLLFR